MDLDHRWDIEPPDLDLPVDDGGGGGDLGGDEPPDGGGGGRREPPPEPFFQSRWGVWVPVGALLLFGGQSLIVMWISRSGLGSEAVAWGLIVLFVATFTAVFIAGARFIARHRH